MKRLFLLFACFYFLSSVAAEEYWHGKERTLRYKPEGKEFVIVNGKIKYNKALYGSNTGFRVETGDVPEFAMYMPGVGGNIHFGLISGSSSKWLNDCSYIESRYLPGKRTYILRDDFFKEGELKIEALALYEEDGFILSFSGKNLPENMQLGWVFGGATGRNLSRHGDLNADPADCFDLKPDYCSDNSYLIEANTFQLTYGKNSKGSVIRYTRGVFPDKATLKIGDSRIQSTLVNAIQSELPESNPMIAGKIELETSGQLYISLYNDRDQLKKINYSDLPSAFERAERDRKAIADRIKIDTPDPFINTLGGVASMAGDAIWDGIVYQHGAVGWRMPLSGWRGAYVADVLGWHDRARTHFSNYAESQVTEPASGPVVMDTALHLARAQEKMGNQMFSSGYICRNPNGKLQPHHYDMNLCYIDELLWHFNWTGDWDYVREMWPVLQRHLAWEKRNFDPDGDGLYDAYACIWASDALQYHSGGVTHSSAYNYRGNKLAAFIAEKLGEDPEPYRMEAEKIKKAMDAKLWLSDRGWWAEYIEFMGDKQVHPSAGLWTIYHAMDAEFQDPFKAYQSLRYVDKEIPHIPVKAKGLDDQHYEVVSTTSWMPYSWSINNVAFAEILHTSLAYWQGGRKEDAFRLWKSSVLDAMYIGSSPGNIVQVCFYDAARGETYRDFADPTGMFARSMVQGLFGIIPDALNKKVTIRPGYPKEWEYASFETPDVQFDYKRTGDTENYTIVLTLPQRCALQLQLPARKDRVKSVALNGKLVSWKQEENSIEIPVLNIDCGMADVYKIVIDWEGNLFPEAKEYIAACSEDFSCELPSQLTKGYDPQEIFSNVQVTGRTFNGKVDGRVGHRTFFAQVKQGDFSYWYPLWLDVRKPLIVLPQDTKGAELKFRVQNNSSYSRNCEVSCGKWKKTIPVGAQESSVLITVPGEYVVPGSNKIYVKDLKDNEIVEGVVINWNLPFAAQPKWTSVEVSKLYNSKISDIFRNKYLSPRSPYGTLQLPWQGIGEWCHPLLTADINEQGLIHSASANKGIYTLPNGISFQVPVTIDSKNIIYTSLWDNYPVSTSIPLEGKASHAYLLMAGSTNHMQSRFVNGVITVTYKDGTTEKLELVNPENWCPIEQDYFHDGYAFDLKSPRPWRIYLKTGEASRDAEKSLGITGVYTRQIDGGAATVVDLPLDSKKELKSLELKATANDVVLGVTAISLVK